MACKPGQGGNIKDGDNKESNVELGNILLCSLIMLPIVFCAKAFALTLTYEGDP